MVQYRIRARTYWYLSGGVYDSAGARTVIGAAPATADVTVTVVVTGKATRWERELFSGTPGAAAEVLFQFALLDETRKRRWVRSKYK